jgi:hypothetical protein
MVLIYQVWIQAEFYMTSFEELLRLSNHERIKRLLTLDSDKRNKLLKEFSPEERINIIKEIKKEREKEEKEAEKLVKESIEQIRDEDEKVKKQPPLDDKKTGISQGFSESELEDRIKADETKTQTEQKNVEYNLGTNRTRVEYAINLYNELGQIAQNVQGGNTGYETMARAGDLYERIKDLGKYEGRTEQVQQIAEGSKRLMKDLFGEYRSKHDYTPGK